MSTFTMADDSAQHVNGEPRFTVIGVGGGGGNAVEHMVSEGLKGITFVCANTDRQVLDGLSAPVKLQLGAASNRGLGAGGNPEIGRESAEAEEAAIRKLLENTDMLFITAGMGGGTGTGAAPVIARIAKEMGVLTVAVVTMPFRHEGGKRTRSAKEGFEQLSNFVDSIITIPNNKVMGIYGSSLTMQEAFKKADEVLLHAVKGIAETVTNPGLINIDFQDVCTAMDSKGHGMMGIGRGSGEDRAREATIKAIRSPLLDDLKLENAKGLLVNIVSSSSIKLDEIDKVNEIVESICDIDNADIFYGSVINEDMGDDLHVTVIATGLTLNEGPSQATQGALGANSTQGIDPRTHTTALSSHQNAAPVTNNVESSEPQAAIQPKVTNSITDYLRSQQNK